MARCAAARASLQAALESIDHVLVAMVAPDADPRGKDRVQALEDADGALGDAASSLHLAMSEFPSIDPTEGEPEPDEDDEDDEDDEEESPRQRGGRR